MLVMSPSGQQYAVVTPSGLYPGQNFIVNVPDGD